MDIRIFVATVDDKAKMQLDTLMAQKAFCNCKVRIMPDVHAGAGRILSRTRAQERITLDEYQKSMEGIYTTSVNEKTLDESPMAYKNMDEIISEVSPSVEVQKIIRLVYNFKAAE